MATIKAYTDLSQSKKLAEILPLESADMSWVNDLSGDHIIARPYDELHKDIEGLRHEYGEIESKEYPAWSLSALLSVLPDGTDIVKDKTDTENEKYMCTVGVKDDIISTFGNNPVDACYEMIIRLNELKML